MNVISIGPPGYVVVILVIGSLIGWARTTRKPGI